MKKRLLFILMSACFLLCGKLLQAQISGNKSIPGDYVTIQAAIAALNSQGVTSPGVTFNVAANHTETFTIATAGTLTTTTSSATAPIVFQKSGTGNNPKIFAAAGTTTNLDGIIKFAGTDYVTFHAIDLSESSSNTTTTTRMEWGYAILKASTTMVLKTLPSETAL
jgi:trimeric autotransporter adhesin